LAKLPDHPREERELEKAIELDAKFAPARNQLGSVLMTQGRLADAEKQFRAAIENDPQYAEALIILELYSGGKTETRTPRDFFARLSRSIRNTRKPSST